MLTRSGHYVRKLELFLGMYFFKRTVDMYVFDETKRDQTVPSLRSTHVRDGLTARGF